jgi:taurine dioxygenase
MKIQKVAGALGAEVLDIDLAKDLNDVTAKEIRKALLDHLVIFFRDQTLTSPQYLAFAKRFGQVMEYPFVRGLDDYPEITPIIKLEHETVNFGGVWHSDTTYLDEPPMGTMLIVQEIPPYGGDTLFANMQLAYERLSPGMKRMLDGLHAFSSSAKADVSRTREDRIRDHAREGAKKEFLARHPVVRTHPESGRKSLFVNIAHTLRFDEMTEAESAPLLHYIYQHQITPEHLCRFRWQKGSIAFWDNRSTLHYPVNDYHGFKRVMHRITLAGDRPR